MLQMLAAEPSNHSYMLQQHDVSSYVEQLVYLASPVQTHGDTVAAAIGAVQRRDAAAPSASAASRACRARAPNPPPERARKSRREAAGSWCVAAAAD